MTCTATCRRWRPSSTTRAATSSASCSAATTRSSAAGRRRRSSGCKALPDALWIRGNGERWTASPDQAPDNPILPGGDRSGQQALGARLVADLAALPANITRGDTLICHGSPVSDVRSFFPEPADDEAGAARRHHRHAPDLRPHPPPVPPHDADGIELINPGSVGMPFDGDPRAAYALVHDDGSIEHRRVAYDHQASAARVREHGTEWAEVVARRIEQSRADV